MFYILTVIVLATFVKLIVSQGFVDDACILRSNGQSGICKLFNDCGSAQEDLKQRKRFPQICGFQKSLPIVCCLPQRKPGEISRSKCREYSAYVYETRTLPINIIDPPQITKNECGHKVVKLIIGGERAGTKEFPHMAAIGFEENSGETEWLCGGTLLSSEFVLTAAHCLSAIGRGDAKWVQLGVSYLNSNTRRKQIIKVAERIPYPEYRLSSHYHDIGLIRLETPAKLDPFARPACLYLEQQIDAQRAIATGWGQTTRGGSGSSNLLKVTIDLFDHGFCNLSYKNLIGSRLSKGIVDEIQVCAGSIDEEKDTCQGDSGGPLQIYHDSKDAECMYDIVGVTSFGRSCSASPGVYVRVSNYIKWIEDIVWPMLS